MTAPEYDRPRQWRCRLCGCERFHRVAVMRNNGTRYETSFLACNGCTVMFLSERQFDAAGNPNVDLPPSTAPIRGRS